MIKQWMRSAGTGVILITWLFAFIPAVSIAEGPDKTWIVHNAPLSYVVKKGDTLWDVSSQFLQDPWRWQDIWQGGSIYPGDKIVLQYVDDKPQLSVERKVTIAHTRESRNRVVILHPEVRILPADRAIPTIPLNVIEPFLNDSRIITKQQATSCPQIVAVDEDHLVVGTGDRVYVSGLTANAPQEVYSVFRPGKMYLDPSTKAPLGLEGIILGQVQLEVPGETARFMITKVFSEIKTGDRIISTQKEKIDPYFVPKYPKGQAKGQIISVFGGLTQIGQFQILAITGGKDKQRSIGDVLAIYQTKKDIPYRLTLDPTKKYKFPPLKTGRCIIFRVFDKVSYVLVMNATRPIYLLDEVGRP